MFIFCLELRRHRRYPEPSDVLRTDSVGRVSSSYLGPIYMGVGTPGILGNPPVHIMLPGTDRVTLSTGVEFCHVDVSKWLDSCCIKIAPNAFGGGFTLLKVKAKALKGYSKSSNWGQKSVEPQSTSFARHFCVYVLNDRSIIKRKCTPG